MHSLYRIIAVENKYSSNISMNFKIYAYILFLGFPSPPPLGKDAFSPFNIINHGFPFAFRLFFYANDFDFL